ncbi:2-amino-4-hydroxy-6-hydroxymethyldihydropteridine diphosphokinase [Gordonia oryzae]|uniref:2-amino-4-hydroxy-6-hydroxymethyldihydropteridine diphosphokinase n=1 Tax=Gordonia oryzae TaxID=2487349 RepID=A0A3N4G204_9ACTN|nr:2-amino-4-hydroxy-6-hydroxymethyldihydropteridine diphosphokinase [Gordonia oryzae]RPA56983.1 2-amino-4-hydroxy-6-hydroxymethyldihydropteridine diphosphokinase [Gordonia oryzae]
MSTPPVGHSRVVLSAGSNIGDPMATLALVPDGFAAAGRDIRVVAVSDVYATAPWGGVAQDDFCNITLIVEGTRQPHEWLRIGADLEDQAHRTREVRWGPRTLDVDVITVDTAGGTVRSADPTLTLPHPRAYQRAFVLLPWLQIDPDAELFTDAGPRLVAELSAALPADERDGVRRIGPLSRSALR